jgi:CrcB protein
MQIFFAIFLGGGMGSVSRYGLSKVITSNFTEINPLGTLAANLISTVILGIVLFLGGTKFELNSITKALIIAGFCGGFSTFSTFSYETFELLKTGNYTIAFANILISVLLGIGVLFILARSL